MKTEQENYPKCRTCRHFTSRNYITYGDCKMITDSPSHRATAFVEGELVIIDPDQFGCILHEQDITTSP